MLIPFAYAAQSVQEAVPSGGLGAIGIDGKVFLFQVINFLLLLILLRWLAYKPILHILDKRRHTIEASLAEAQKIEETKVKLAEDQEEVLRKAYKRSEVIVEEAKKHAQQLVSEAQTKAQEQTQTILKETEGQIASEIESAKQILRKETIQLVALATRHIISEKLDEKKDAELIHRAIKAAEETR